MMGTRVTPCLHVTLHFTLTVVLPYVQTSLPMEFITVAGRLPSPYCWCFVRNPASFTTVWMFIKPCNCNGISTTNLHCGELIPNFWLPSTGIIKVPNPSWVVSPGVNHYTSWWLKDSGRLGCHGRLRGGICGSGRPLDWITSCQFCFFQILRDVVESDNFELTNRGLPSIFLKAVKVKSSLG